MKKDIIEICQAGIKANESDSFRKKNIVELADAGDLIVSGDIHGHKRNFNRLLSYADLASNPQRHLILQEIIHGGKENSEGGCLSYKVLLEAIKLKIDYPDRVHMILANHDTAFINNSEVMKNGKEMNKAMRDALESEFADSFAEVESAIERFLFSQPLAVRCKNGIWIAHSLPANRFIDDFDYSIFSRELKISDIVRPNSAYTLTWGRRQSLETLEKFAEKMNVRLLIFGHQVQESGWCCNDKNLVIIDSQHNHGYLMHIDLSKEYTIDELVKTLKQLAEIA